MAQPQLFGYPLVVLAWINGKAVDVSAVLQGPVPTATGRDALGIDLDAFLDIAQAEETGRV